DECKAESPAGGWRRGTFGPGPARSRPAPGSFRPDWTGGPGSRRQPVVPESIASAPASGQGALHPGGMRRAPVQRNHAHRGGKGYPIRLRLLHSSTPMLFQHVAIAGLAHIDAPRRLSSAEINGRLKPPLDRLGSKAAVLGHIARIHPRYLWQDHGQASHVATLPRVRALADAGIDPDNVGLVVDPSRSRGYLGPPPASIVSGKVGLPETCQNVAVANACLAFINGM